MIWTLRILFLLILITMIIVTGTASLAQNILAIPEPVTSNPWFIATMFDAYFGFTTFYAWVFYRTPSWAARFAWFFLIMLLGNMAMAFYMLMILFRLPTTATVADVLLREPTPEKVPV